MNLTRDEIKIIRKALQIILMAHLAVSTNEGEDYKDTKIDELLKKFRKAEEENECK
jgi:hypothetical protein